MSFLSSLEPRVDGYCATVPASQDAVIHALVGWLGPSVAEVRVCRAVLNYDNAVELVDCLDQRIAVILWGGRNGASAHVRAFGHHASDVFVLLRKTWPVHRVVRCDIAMDFDEPGAFDKLVEMILKIAKQADLKVKQVGDFREDRDPTSGRTYYIGSRQSLCMIRIYEKGLEQLAKGRVGDAPISPNWVRVELEVKPQNGPAKERASRLSPAEFFGLSHWTRTAYQRLTGASVKRCSMTLERESDDFRAIRHVAVQYRQIMDRCAARLGGRAALYDFIERVQREAEDRTGSVVKPDLASTPSP